MNQHLNEDFTLVTTADIPLLCEYIKKANYSESNHNIINMFQWFNQFPLWQYHTENYMLLLGIHKGHLFSYMPLCEEKYFREAMLKARHIFKQFHIPFELSCFTEENKDKVLHIFPHMRASTEREAADYIHETEKLRTLSGKKLQKRRNNYNNFVKSYENHWTYEDLSLDNLQDVKNYLYTWKRDTDEEYLRYEIEGADRILDLFNVIPYKGGVIRIDSEVKAFIIVSECVDNMIQINIEKAEPSIRGLYQAIEKEFLSRHYLEVEWANREDDMGDENLRQAKLALDPHHMIEKYRIKEQL